MIYFFLVIDRIQISFKVHLTDFLKTKRERERERERERKTMVALLGFIMATLAEKKLLDAKGPFGGNVIKNPARYIRPKILKT